MLGKYDMEHDVLKMLAAYRDGQMSREDLIRWFDTQKATLSTQLPRSSFLQLRYASAYVAATALAKVLPACTNCSAICPQHIFSSWQEYKQCEGRVDHAEAVGTLLRMSPPAWAVDIPKGGGADGYYRCSKCGAVWGIVRPERQENGSWRRLA